MNVQVENLENRMAKLTITVPEDAFEKALDQAYQKQRNKYIVKGFRKGKAPRKILEQMYGADLFYADAANTVYLPVFYEALEEYGIHAYSQAKIDIVQLTPGEPFVFSAEFALEPKVTLGQYKGLQIPQVKVEVTDEDVEQAVEEERERNARITDVDDRPVQWYDYVTLDMQLFVDGDPLPKEDKLEVQIGSGALNIHLEEELVGASIGEEREAPAHYAQDYPDAELRGKKGVCKYRVKEIRLKELPEADDEFAQDVSEFDTLEEYKEDLRRQILQNKEIEVRKLKEHLLLSEAIENAKVEIAGAMLDTQVASAVADLKKDAEAKNLSFEEYLKRQGFKEENLEQQCRQTIEDQLKSGLVMDAIAKEEGISVSDERLDEEIEKALAHYHGDPARAETLRKDPDEREKYRSQLVTGLVMDLLVDSAVIVEVP